MKIDMGVSHFSQYAIFWIMDLGLYNGEAKYFLGGYLICFMLCIGKI